MEDEYFFKLIHFRIAQISISQSTFRGQAKNLQIARTYLESINLDEFFERLKDINDADGTKFNNYLKEHTKSLSKKFRKGGSCGIARKCLNLFFREVVYNVYLCEKYIFFPFKRNKKSFLERLEIPIDRGVGKCLNCLKRKYNQNKNREQIEFSLSTIKKLKGDNYNKIQDFASFCAKKNNTIRIHLDLEFWRHKNNKGEDCCIIYNNIN